MNARNTTASLFEPDQFRMCRLQVFNWGTFSGIHDIPVSEHGYLLIGRSGAGKTTLLDALSALIVPPRWIDFNAAARGEDRKGRDRNLVSYVRGAWGEQREGGSGEIAVQYLRPGTTWSALALTYRNSAGRHVTLVQLFWLRGNSASNADVKRLYFVFEREFDLAELEPFGKSNFDVRKLKQMFPDVPAPKSEFSPYGERFCNLLGIESEMALRLLHKTQSAKNLGDLNASLREYMLDKPETFEVADQLVSEFGELNAAHQAVITARMQIETLQPAREQHRTMKSLQGKRDELEALQRGLHVYREARRIGLLKKQVDSLVVQADAHQSEVARRRGIEENKSAELGELEAQHLEKGGAAIARWEEEKKTLEQQRDDRLSKQGMMREACKRLGWVAPETTQGFAAILGDARREIEGQDERNAEARDTRDNLVQEKRDAEAAFKEAAAEVKALERQSSNIRANMLELRREIAEAIGVSESALPFIGELIEVKPDESTWQGVIERVLHGFALSVVVDERNYAALTAHLNATDLKRRRLVFYRTTREDAGQSRPVAPNSLVLKLNIKECAHADWLRAELRQRFDYPCIDSIPAFRNADRGVTKDGLVKHGKTRHEKDDRHAINDRGNWMLGFDNREKRALFVRQAQEGAVKIERLQGEINKLEQEEKDRSARALLCQSLVNLKWDEVDPKPLLDRIDGLNRSIKEAREGNTDLREIAERMTNCREALEKARKSLRNAEVDLEGTNRQLAAMRKKLEAHERDMPQTALDEAVECGLAARFEQPGIDINLDNLDRLATDVVQQINDDLKAVDEKINACAKAIEGSFARFIQKWPAESDGLDATLDATDDFFARLTRLEQDGLPTHEHRFFELLRNQSHQNLAALSTYMNDARKTILERMELVNASLGQVPFNKNADQITFLHIEATDRQLPEVREFKAELNQTLSNAWTEDREQAEARFMSLRRLVDRLSSQESDARRWRDLVLDVRLHVEFIGRELDEAGVEVEVYRGSSGKSGGQRQKLAATCLAAALRYQLGGIERGFPMYAPVVLDEAFSNADQDFTTLAMNIFENFGFQMIVATPLKSVMTLEPFIGGACFVDIKDRRVSSVLMIDYDDEHKELKWPDRARAETSDEVS